MKKVLLAIGYWFLSLTWGLLMTVIGLLVTAFIIVFLRGKVHKNGFSYIVEIGGNWGGVNLGVASLCGGYTATCPNEEWFQHTRRHEFGHGLQNCVFGPLFPFLVAIPSAVRYHYQNWRSKKGLHNKDYDAAIYEYTASKYGYKAINSIENQYMPYTYVRR